MIATKTAVIVLCEEAALIWAIPPLSSQPPDFFDNPTMTHMPPLFTIPFPETALHPERIRRNRISSWYSCSSHPLYFDIHCEDSKLHRLQIILEPDLSTASLHVISASEVTPHNFIYTFFEDYRICEDTLVSCWIRDDPARPEQYQCGVYTGLTSARFSNFISHGGPAAKMLLPDIEYEYVHYLCPASGRYVRMDSSSSVVVFDFF